MPDAHQDVSWPPISHVPRKINNGCPARCQVPTKMPHAHQKKGWVLTKCWCSPKYILGAQQDARWHPKCRVPTKRNAGCPQRGQVAKKKPCVHQIKSGCLIKMPGGHQKKCWVPTNMPGGHRKNDTRPAR